MLDIIFYIFAALTILSAILVPVSRNPVNGAMFMIVSFVSTACLYVLLNAYFLAVLQILVYAGAIIVLFLFIIMLLNVEQVKTLRPSFFSQIAGLLALCILSLGVGSLFLSGSANPSPELAVSAGSGIARNFGYMLFTKYMLPFQVSGFMLLVSMIGVILLSKKINVEVPSRKEQGDA
ncbi:MAG: NADH-quinone oxidoreductase subunit J [Opitutales bacterium]|nr:NADH-quinone oxidoreductase subunit J [Opitutales bacterium]